MKFFIDTANIMKKLKKGIEMGLVDGVTTDPHSLQKKKESPETTIQEILSVVEGPVSLEVIAKRFQGNVRRGQKTLCAGSKCRDKDPYDRRRSQGSSHAIPGRH